MAIHNRTTPLRYLPKLSNHMETSTQNAPPVDLDRLVRRGQFCPKQQEINRLRRVLHDIADSRPDQHMDIEKTPELTEWICETCRKASVGAYPYSSNADVESPMRKERQ